ncbi:MAG: hypothetical protein NTW94_06600 [Legionellales bacterium]|nr:hypothetical protein [Legionellales bacterium]
MKPLIKQISTLGIASILHFTPIMATSGATPTWALALNSLNTHDWNAVCSDGAPTDQSGCLGNTSSIAFQKVSHGTGGFTTWANIQPANVPESVFIKAFLADTNHPIAPPNINIQVRVGAARCALFTTPGESIGLNGINNLNPTPGNTQIQSDPFGLVIALNMSSGGFTYEHQPTPLEANPQYPIYVMCVAYDPADGATAVSTAGSITAI